MANKNTETCACGCKAQESQCVKNALPSWISVLAIVITALIAGFVLLRI